MTQSGGGGGVENTSSSVTLFNFQKSGGAEAPPQPLPLRGPCLSRVKSKQMKEARFSFSHLQLSTSRRQKVQVAAEKFTLTKIISVDFFLNFNLPRLCILCQKGLVVALPLCLI